MKCPSTSSCHAPGYTPSKVKLTNETAVQCLIKHLQAAYIYRNSNDFCRVRTCTAVHIVMTCVLLCTCSLVYVQCRDTYWVESFNHQLLTYLPKRIHFSKKAFNMRMNLAVLDWVSESRVLFTVHIHIINIIIIFMLE